MIVTAFRRGVLYGVLLSVGFWCGVLAAPRSYEFHTRKQRRP